MRLASSGAWLGLLAGGLDHLVQPAGKMAHDLLGEGHDLGPATVVLSEQRLRRLLVAIGESDEERDVPAPPLVDGLIVVADDREVGSELEKVAGETVLEGVHVLELVHQDVAHSPIELLAQSAPGSELFRGALDHRAKREKAHLPQKPLVALDGLNEAGHAGS